MGEHVKAYDTEMKALEVTSRLIHEIVNNMDTPPSKIILATDNTGTLNESSKAALEKPKSVQTPSENTFSIYWTSTKPSSLRSHGAQATLTSKEMKEQTD